MTRVALLHTVPGNAAVFAGLLDAEVGTVSAVHVVDESLLTDTVAHGMLPETMGRVAEYAAFAERAGAGALLVTCSSIGEAAEQARAGVGIPIYRVDEPMAAEAVATGRRVGVLATLASTLGPTLNLLRRKAAERDAAAAPDAAYGADPDSGTGYTFVESVCDGAFDALKAGDTGRHDEIVAAEIHRLAAEVDVLVLAQASMARVADALPGGAVSVPILRSPVSGVRQLRPHAGGSGQPA